MQPVRSILAALAAAAGVMMMAAPQALAAPSSYAEIDRHALSVSVREAGSVAQLAAALTRPARSDREKARAIFRWMAANIAYDERGFFTGRAGDTSPLGVLRRRQSVCAGYSRLFEALAGAAGLQVASIWGHGKGVGYRPGAPAASANHDWNAVKIDGRWQLLDVTWGAGAFLGAHWERHFTEHYFLTAPDEFIFDHFPNDSRWQLLARPVTREEYVQSVCLRPNFFQLGLKVGSHREARVTAGESACFTFRAPADVALSARLLPATGDAALEKSTLCQRAGDEIQVLVRWPHPGHYRLLIFAKRRNEKGLFWEAAEYDLTATGGAGAGACFPSTFGTFAERGVTLHAPLDGVLAAGRPQAFALSVPGAREVAVVSHGQWHPLARRGSEFTGTITPAAGDVTVIADTWSLATYQAR